MPRVVPWGRAAGKRSAHFFGRRMPYETRRPGDSACLRVRGAARSSNRLRTSCPDHGRRLFAAAVGKRIARGPGCAENRAQGMLRARRSGQRGGDAGILPEKWARTGLARMSARKIGRVARILRRPPHGHGFPVVFSRSASLSPRDSVTGICTTPLPAGRPLSTAPGRPGSVRRRHLRTSCPLWRLPSGPLQIREARTNAERSHGPCRGTRL